MGEFQIPLNLEQGLAASWNLIMHQTLRPLPIDILSQIDPILGLVQQFQLSLPTLLYQLPLELGYLPYAVTYLV